MLITTFETESDNLKLNLIVGPDCRLIMVL